jgi:hypothetical protein
MLRVTAVPEVARQGYTVLGWRVSEIGQVCAGLRARGVAFSRYEGMDQDYNGIWTTPGGDRIAWFTRSRRQYAVAQSVRLIAVP